MYDVFQQLMDANGVNRADVSRATGIAQSTLSNWRKRGGSLSAFFGHPVVKNAHFVRFRAFVVRFCEK